MARPACPEPALELRFGDPTAPTWRPDRTNLATRPLEVEGAADDLFHHLGGAAVDGLDAGVEIRAGDRVLGHVPVAAEELQTLIDHPLLQLGRPPLRLGRV